MTKDLHTILILAGALHFTQLPAMFLTPRILDWHGDFAKVSPINRQIVKVVLGGIMLCVLGLGAVVVLSATDLVGSPLGLRLCIFLATFWSYRAIVQSFVYSRTWPRQARWAHLGLCGLFPTLVALYGYCAWTLWSSS